MSARDELARDWAAAFNSDIPVVDYLHAAGYTKPRTITTAEELDELAEGVVLLDKYGVANQLTTERITEGPAERYWDTTGHDRNSSVALPATVLFEPAPEAPPARAWPAIPERGDREYRQAQWDHARTPGRYGGGLG